MAQKKYNFNKILKEYNKIYGYDYKISPKEVSVVIVHTLETGTFHVTYSNIDGLCKNKKTLENFIYYHISSNISNRYIQDILLSKEEKELNLKIEIWPPSKIRYAYLYTNYFVRDKGHLGKSCMRSKEMQKSLNFYIKNKVRIVVATDDKNKIHARALLWDDVKSTRRKGIFTYLDRIYARSDSPLPLFRELAKKHKWEQYESTSAGEAKSTLYKDSLDITGLYHLPYTDTFKYLYYKDNLVSSGNVPSMVTYRDDVLTLTHVGDGGYFPTLDPNRVREAISGKHISKKDAVFVKKYESSYDGYVLKSNIANIGSAYYSKLDNKIVLTELDGYVFKKDVVNEVITDDKISKVTAVHSVKYNGYIHKSNAMSLGDEIYHKRDADIICFKINGVEKKWYHISQCFVNYNREEVNEELAKQVLSAYAYSPKDCALYGRENYIPYCRIAKAVTTKKDNLIPKEHAIIAYNLIYSPILDDIEYQEVYCTSKDNFIRLITGELIVNSAQNKKHIKKFNNKYYVRQEFKLPNKKQLTFSFGG